MRNESNEKTKTGVGEINKRRETMADGRRYIIYYTFGETIETPEKAEESEVKKNV